MNLYQKQNKQTLKQNREKHLTDKYFTAEVNVKSDPKQKQWLCLKINLNGGYHNPESKGYHYHL